MRRVTKRCQKCDWIGDVSIRQRKCQQWTFGRGSYACWGDLVRVSSARDETPAPALPRRAQDVALDRLRQTQRAIDKKLGHIADLSKSLQRALKMLDKLRRRAEMLEAKSRMTDQEVQAERDARKQRAEDRRRKRGERSVALGRAAFER